MAETEPPARPSLQPLAPGLRFGVQTPAWDGAPKGARCWHRALRDPSPSTTSQGKDPKSVEQSFLPAWGFNSIICKILFAPLKMKIFLLAALCFYPFQPLLP